MTLHDVIMDGVRCQFDDQTKNLIINTTELGNNFELSVDKFSHKDRFDIKQVRLNGDIDLDKLTINLSGTELYHSPKDYSSLSSHIEVFVNNGKENSLEFSSIKIGTLSSSSYDEFITFRDSVIGHFMINALIEQVDSYDMITLRDSIINNITKYAENFNNYTNAVNETLFVVKNCEIQKLVTHDPIFDLALRGTSTLDKFHYPIHDNPLSKKDQVRLYDTSRLLNAYINGPARIMVKHTAQISIHTPEYLKVESTLQSDTVLSKITKKV